MKVLVACEFSGTVRDAFRDLGHDAWSCDLLSSERPGQHIVGDVLAILGDGWDLMIAHPPCTYLCVSGLHWNGRIEGRAEKTEEALAFVQRLLEAPIPMIALENPVGAISKRIRKPDQIIQPWQFGHRESKQTCLWLKGLPLLQPTDIIKPAKLQANGKPQWDNQTPTGQNKLGPSADRWKLRSVTYPGIANAMSAQWSGWAKVSFASECGEDGNCPKCGIDYAECGCIGPTQDGYEYREIGGIMYARPESTDGRS